MPNFHPPTQPSTDRLFDLPLVFATHSDCSQKKQKQTAIEIKAKTRAFHI